MNAGYSGAFVISWAQTEMDGQSDAAISALRIGMEWRWSGQAVRVDGPANVLPLCGAVGEVDLHQRAAVRLQKRSGAAAPRHSLAPHLAPHSDTALMTQGFTVTDGRQKWDLSVVGGGSRTQILLLCLNALPPPDRDLWVVHHTLTAAPLPTGGVICFTPGTMIQTETGPRPVELLSAGDRVQTKDNGCQPVLWIGSRRLTGARLYAMPHLRPVRFAAGAMGQDRPDAALIVSPDHRVVLRGPVARALFNSDEVLVRARDLINDRTILTDHGWRNVTYFHLLLPAHEIVFANGVETESFHPENAALDPDQWAVVEVQIPDLKTDSTAYGPPARRILLPSEAAIMQHMPGSRQAAPLRERVVKSVDRLGQADQR